VRVGEKRRGRPATWADDPRHRTRAEVELAQAPLALRAVGRHKVRQRGFERIGKTHSRVSLHQLVKELRRNDEHDARHAQR